MFCRYCGTENQEDYSFCMKCGKSLILHDFKAGRAEERDESPPDHALIEDSRIKQENLTPDDPKASIEFGVPREESKSNFTPDRRHDNYCPKCGAAPELCIPISRTDVKIKGGGYHFVSGCCGAILLGPFGLLCGACGSQGHAKVRNETWFVCRRCGTEFMSIHSAMENAASSIYSVALYTIFLAFGIGMEWGTEDSFWMTIVLGGIILALWAGIPFTISESTGKPLDELFQSDLLEPPLVAKYIIFFIGSLILGLMLGAN